MATDLKPPYVNQSTLKPIPKVVAGGIGSSIVVLLVWIAGEYGVQIPPEVASALTVLVGFAASYFVKNRAA